MSLDVEKFINGLHEYLERALSPLTARTKSLEARIEQLEAAPFAYLGPHEAEKLYSKGAFVTHDGSLWHCNYKTASRPGDGQAWTLAVKRGRDAK